MTRLVIIACSAIALVNSVGCSIGPWSKRSQELSCPTDIRKMHPWCCGEDAVFDCPCGPDESYHGHKPTCWRDWQAPAAVWRDERCGCSTPSYGPMPLSSTYSDASPTTVVVPTPTLEPRLDSSEEVNPEGLPYETLPVGPEGLEKTDEEAETLPREALNPSQEGGYALPVASWLQSPQQSPTEGRRMPLVNEEGPWSHPPGRAQSDTSQSPQTGGYGSFGFRIVN